MGGGVVPAGVFVFELSSSKNSVKTINAAQQNWRSAF